MTRLCDVLCSHVGLVVCIIDSKFAHRTLHDIVTMKKTSLEYDVGFYYHVDEIANG